VVELAQAFPQAKFFGFDTDEDAIEAARKAARAAGVTERVYFQLGSPVDFPGWDFDLITFVNCMHHMRHPDGAARRVRSGLSADGAWMIVEPRPGEQPAVTTTPGTNAVLGEKKLRQVAEAAGFTRFRRAAETLYHVVFEVRT
jgi:SAM-dependent methyltransferase